MNFCRISLYAICLIAFSGCKGGSGGGVGSFFNPSNSSTPVTPALQASQTETTKLLKALEAEPAYKIENSEITVLQNEGILTEAELSQLQAIQ